MRITLLAAVILAAIGVGMYWMNDQAAEPLSTEEIAAQFDRAEWVANRGVFDETNTRRDMVGAAVAQISKGMSEADVLKALGEPDDQFETRWRYSTGPRRGFETDEGVLVVEFANGGVTEAFSSFTARLR